MSDIEKALEAAREEVMRITPQPGDLVVIRFASALSVDMQDLIGEWWHRNFPGIAMLPLEPGGDISVMRPEGASLRALAEALRPILTELDHEGSLGA